MVMRDHMKRQMRQMIAQLRDMQLTMGANWKTSMMLRDALARNDVPSKTAEAIAIRMKVDVDEDLFTDDHAFVTEIVDGLAVGIANLYRALGTDLRHIPSDEAILEIATQFEIKLNF